MEVNVAVPYPREYLRLVILQSYLGVTRYIAARFKKDTVDEVTVCWSTPNIPGRPCLCNLTADNHNHPFYCGRPLDSRLSCLDWIATTVLHMPAPPSERFSTVEMLLIKNAFGPVKKHLIRHTVKVIVSTKGKLPNLLPCSHMSPNVTWDWSQWPTAYWTNKNTWRSLICVAPELTPKWAIPCLSNTRVWIFGDSNSWRLFLALMKKVEIPHDGTSWSFQQYVRNKKANITISLSPLEYPLYFGKYLWRDRITADGVAQQLDHIPSTGRHIVIIHYYLHVTSSHLSVLEARLKILEASIKRLLVRNPDVVIGIRGPHTVSKMWDINQAVGGDCLGTFFLNMLSEVFKDLQHKIVFLDGWEMTIASENLDRHPPPAVADQLIRTLLSFICD